MKLPEHFEEKMKDLLKEDYENYLHSFQDDYGQTLRVNQLKERPADFIRRFPLSVDQKVAWCENGFYYEGEERLSLHPWYYGGVYYIQEPSAMAPASFLPVEPGDKVLDLCAAPGGKTTALSAKLAGEGVIVANDISASRCKALLKNMEMAGVANGMVVCEEPAKLADRFVSYFDKILVDAPCSGEGMFRKDPAMVRFWSKEEVARYSEIQKDLLGLASAMVRPGGYILYSTCTYSPEEDEAVVASLLDASEEYELVELPMFEGVDTGHPEWCGSSREELKHCRRFWNHRVCGEGQFMALIHRKECDITESTSSKNAACAVDKKRKKTKKGSARPDRGGKKKVDPTELIRQELHSFLKHCKKEFPSEQIEIMEERCFFLPKDLPDLSGIRIIRSGLFLGSGKKNRFEPAQALAMALKPEEFDNSISLSWEDERIERYLRCETIEAEAEDGFVLVCVDGFPLGWGKCKNNVIKNKYTPGWRKG